MTEKGYAVITGASSGIGAATAQALAAEGFRVIATARRADLLNELASASPLIEVLEIDVTSQDDIDRLDQYLADKDVTVLFANAGGAFDAKPIAQADIAAWEKTYEVNVVGLVRTVKMCVPHLVKSQRGTIVLTG